MADANTHNSIGYIFNPKYERVYFGLIIMVMIIGFCALIGFLPLNDLTMTIESRAAVAFLFFNYLHSPLSFLGLLALPELRGWVKNQFNLKRFFIFVSISCAILAFGYVRTHRPGMYSVDERLLMSIAVLLVSFHNMGQTKGLSLLYNQRTRERLSAEQLERHSKIEAVERWIFLLLVSVILLRAVNEAYDLKILYGYLRWVFVVGVLALIANALRYPLLFKSGKFIFLQSLWAYVLSMFIPGALPLQMLLHGVEYVLLSERMVQKSKFEINRFWIVFGSGFLIVFALFGAIDIKMFGEMKSILNERTLPWIFAISLWIEYFHYYVDSQIFRFKDPYVRSNIGTLLR